MTEINELNTITDYVLMNNNLKTETESKSNINSNNKEFTNSITFLIFFCFFVVATEFLTRSPLDNLGSIILTNWITVEKNCQLISILAMSTNSVFMFLLICIFNLFDLHCTFIWLYLVTTGKIISGVLILIYQSPRPFFVNKDFPPCFCKVSFGTPSESSASIFLMIMGLYRILVVKYIGKFMKYSILVLGLAIILSSSMIELVSNTETLSQVLYGLIIGGIIYYIFFNICKINPEKKEQFLLLLNNNFGMKLGGVLVISTVLFNLAHYFLRTLVITYEEMWFNNLDLFCSELNYKYLDRESYYLIMFIFLSVSGFIAVYMEYVFSFKSDLMQFSSYNLEHFNRWNKTNFSFILMRITFSFVLYKLFDKVIDTYLKIDNTYLKLLIYALIQLFWGFFIFGLSKIILLYICLTNETFWHDYILLDSEDVSSKKKSDFLFLKENNQNRNTHIITGDDLFISPDKNRKNNTEIDYFNLERDEIMAIQNEREFKTPPNQRLQ